MDDFKGTPGPWEKDGVEIRGAAQHQSECICVMTPGFEREDALLIAAAPELLAALQAMELEYGGLGEYDLDYSEPVKLAMAAIAKALGK